MYYTFVWDKYKNDEFPPYWKIVAYILVQNPLNWKISLENSFSQPKQTSIGVEFFHAIQLDYIWCFRIWISYKLLAMFVKYSK